MWRYFNAFSCTWGCVCLWEREGGWEGEKGRSESNPCILVAVTATWQLSSRIRTARENIILDSLAPSVVVFEEHYIYLPMVIMALDLFKSLIKLILNFLYFPPNCVDSKVAFGFNSQAVFLVTQYAFLFNSLNASWTFLSVFWFPLVTARFKLYQALHTDGNLTGYSTLYMWFSRIINPACSFVNLSIVRQFLSKMKIYSRPY